MSVTEKVISSVGFTLGAFQKCRCRGVLTTVPHSKRGVEDNTDKSRTEDKQDEN